VVDGLNSAHVALPLGSVEHAPLLVYPGQPAKDKKRPMCPLCLTWLTAA
jgi:hypothetical protein